MTAMRTRLLALVVLSWAALGCTKRAPLPPQVSRAPSPPSVLDAGLAAPTVASSPEPTRAEIERDVRAVIEKWASAQNRGDFTAYSALYEQTHFRGLKRTKDGKSTRADWAAWREFFDAQIPPSFRLGACRRSRCRR